MGDLNQYFSRSEFACKCGCGFDTVDSELLKLLTRIREHFDVPVHINSGARCWEHHVAIYAKLGKEPTAHSQHLFGRAADIVVDGVPADLVRELAHNIGAQGVGGYDDFTHIDSRSTGIARWGKHDPK